MGFQSSRSKKGGRRRGPRIARPRLYATPFFELREPTLARPPTHAAWIPDTSGILDSGGVRGREAPEGAAGYIQFDRAAPAEEILG